MEAVHSLWNRYGARLVESDSDEGYTPLYGPPASKLPSSSSNRDTQVHDTTTHGSSRPFEPSPIISWRTEPHWEVSVNTRGLGRRMIPVLVALLPSFVLPSRGKKVRKLYPTSYLDGLRGVAALFVAIHHYVIVFTSISATGYGLQQGEKDSHNWFFLLPIIRVVHSGRFMVVIFFVISGYVLSYRGLKLARQGKYLELLDSLASSVFRRWLRLHLPVVASTFVAFMLCRWDLWTEIPKGWEHFPDGKSFIADQPMPFPHPKGTFFHQLDDWYRDTRQLCDPFLYGHVTVSKYNIGVLWTIPLEWMGSMLVFVVVLGISRTRTWVKLGVLSVLIYRTHQTTRWVPACFLEGVFLAELSFLYSRPIESPTPILDEFNEKKAKPSRNQRYRATAYKAFFLLVFLIAIYIGAQPRDSWHKTPGYRWLFRNLPEAYAKDKDRGTFWPSVGGFLMILSLEMAPFLQSIFTTSFAQYLGDISFSLYMIHVQVLFTLGHWLVPKCMDFTGGWSNGQTGFVSGIVLAVSVCGPVTFWASDVFSRCVDEKCVKFARWVSDKSVARK